MRLAWYSPLPPIPSGISDYSFTLLSRLASRASVLAVSPPAGRRPPRAPAGVAVAPPGSPVEGPDAVLYHLGNNPFHRFVYEAAVRRPGVAVFHDLVLHHFLWWLTLKQGPPDWGRYAALLEGDHGPAGRRAADLRRRGVATELEKFLFPLSAHVARGARAMVAHSQFVRDRLAEVSPGVPVAVIPHHAPPPPAEVRGLTREEARRSLGLPRGAFLVGHFGYVSPAKQPGAVLGGFARLAARLPEARLLVVGADHSGGGLRWLVDRFGLRGRVTLTGFVDLPRFHRYLRAVDAAVSLRYPSAGESSGSVARALGEGLPVVVSNVGAFAELPDGAVCKVEVDEDQAERVGEHLVRLAEDDRFRAGVGEAARAHAATALDPDRCAELYLEAARAAAG